MRLLLALILLFPTFAANAQAVRMIKYQTGTGFFVTRDGHILTNNHVIKGCGQININGENTSAAAKLVATDTEHDLALLKAAFPVNDMAYFNSMKEPIKPEDPVVIIGFPLNSWRSHTPVIRSSKILDTKGPQGEDKWLQFDDSVQHGNSGGPLLDSSGNVVGVVVAKAELTIKNQSYQGETVVKKSDIAISTPIIQKFLEQNNVQYQTRDSGIYMSADRVNDLAGSFIVNVYCKIGEE